MNSIIRSSVTALALGATLLTTTVPQPALADGRASTRNLILAGAAALLLTGAAINANHRRTSGGNQIVGYLRDGSTVYADGHVVDDNGNAWNPADRGLQVACDGERCRLVQNDDNSGYGAYENNSNGYQNQRQNGGYQTRDGRHHHHHGGGRPN